MATLVIDHVEANGRDDIGTLLGLAGIGMRLLFILYAVTFITLAITSGNARLWQVIVALAVAVAAAAAAAMPGSYPLSALRTGSILCVVAAVTSLVVPVLPTTGDPGYASWNFGACTFLLFALALRGRVRWAWVGMGVVAAITTLWSTTATGSPAHGVELVYGQAGSLLAGTFFAVLLKRTAAEILAFQEVEKKRVGEEQMLREGEEERQRQLQRLSDRVLEPLRLIASGGVSASERRQHGLLEATLRDGIRGKGLQHEPLTSAVESARRRGIDVLLLDDCGASGISPEVSMLSASWAAERVAAAANGPITIRLSIDDDGPLITVAAGEGRPDSRRFDGLG